MILELLGMIFPSTFLSWVLAFSFQDESTLIWYVGRVEKKLILTKVSKVIPGQRTVSRCITTFSFS